MGQPGNRSRAFGAALALLVLAGAAGAEPNEPVGRRFHVTADQLPAPYATPAASNGARRVPRPPDASLNVPAGFTVTLFRTGLTGPRWMAVAENGDVVLAETFADRVLILRDADGDGAAEQVTVFIDRLEKPHGLLIRDGHLLVADTVQVWRFAYRPGQTEAEGEPEKVTAPGALGFGGGHWTRNLAASADGSRLFVAIGSRGNVAEEPEPRATVRVFGKGDGVGRTFAAGLRNPVGIAVHPATGELYVTVNERDGLGDGLVPDYLTRVQDGDFYGWPYAYAGPNPDPKFGDRRPDLVAASQVPDVLFQSHSAPIGLVFYDARRFPARFRGGAFVALRGSWNASRPTGYKVVYVPFRDGRPVGGYENFATGFWVAGEDQARVIGRPAGLAVARDGSLLIADDTGGAIWRIDHPGE